MLEESKLLRTAATEPPHAGRKRGPGTKHANTRTIQHALSAFDGYEGDDDDNNRPGASGGGRAGRTTRGKSHIPLQCQSFFLKKKTSRGERFKQPPV
jgi:hypothetical protein